MVRITLATMFVLFGSTTAAALEKPVPYGQVHRPLKRPISENSRYDYGTVTQLDDTFGR